MFNHQLHFNIHLHVHLIRYNDFFYNFVLGALRWIHACLYSSVVAAAADGLHQFTYSDLPDWLGSIQTLSINKFFISIFQFYSISIERCERVGENRKMRPLAARKLFGNMLCIVLAASVLLLCACRVNLVYLIWLDFRCRCHCCWCRRRRRLPC